MAAPEEVYVLLKTTGGIDTTALVAHTSLQGASLEMVSYPPPEQKNMWVVPVRLVDDDDD